MREVELKGVVPDLPRAIERMRRAGAKEVFTGALIDRRYDTAERRLRARDEVLRVRIAQANGERRARLDLKGPATYPGGYKVREEIGTDLMDAEVLERAFEALGLIVTREIEREIVTFDCRGALVRFEQYPRMDVLVEVEGEPAQIEEAIRLLDLPRASFTSERLAEFVKRFESRTGERAALCARELEGDFRYRLDDA